MKVSATEFKARCLKLMDEVQKTHEPVVITKHGKPVAKLVPMEPDESLFGFGCMAGTLEITGDIMTPAADEDWYAALGDEAHFYSASGVAEPGPDEEPS